MRARLSSSPLPKPVTIITDGIFFECETFILSEALKNTGGVSCIHWMNHLLLRYYPDNIGPKDVYFTRGKFEDLRLLIGGRLIDAGFGREAREVGSADSEENMNQMIIRQYTRDDVCSAVNLLLRDGVMGRNIGAHPLAAWILQLNAALRLLPEYRGVTYRGASFSSTDLEQYQIDAQFIWSAFTSTTKSEAIAHDFRTNVLFEFHPCCHPTGWDKRAGRLISHASDITSEEEVLLPMCCAFQVAERRREGTFDRIRLNVLSHYPVPPPGKGLLLPIKPTYWFEKEY